MARFTSTQSLDMKWRDGHFFRGAAGTEFELPDSLVGVLEADGLDTLIPGFVWVSQDDTPEFPIAQSDVTDLETDLATISASASSALSSAATKLPLAGGTVTGQIDIKGNTAFAKPYDTDLWIAGGVRSNPAALSQGMYIQHRVAANVASQTHDALAAEIRLSSITGAAHFLNAFEASVVVTGGTNAIVDTRGITVNLHYEGSPAGSVTRASGLVIQKFLGNVGVTMNTVYGIYVEEQTAGSTNWSIYSPGGSSLFGELYVDKSAGAAGDFRFTTAGVLRWIIRKNSTSESGSNAGSDLEILARTDAGGANFTPLRIFRNTGGVQIGNVPIGFFAATPASKQTVTGSRGSNAALASLLTALATYGIITDSSS